MNKMILVVENSITVQKIFTKTFDEGYNFRFESDLGKLVEAVFDFFPDILLLNSDFSEPSSFDFVKLIRSIPCFKNLAIGMYSNTENSFDEEFAYSCGANTFVRLDPKTLLLNVEELSEISSCSGEMMDKADVIQARKTMDDRKLVVISSGMNGEARLRNKILKSLFSMMNNMESVESVAKEFLSFLAEFMCAPAVSLNLVENNGPHSYVMCSSLLSDAEKEDFLKVCKSDFEDLDLDSSLSMLVPQFLDSGINMDALKTSGVPLSSYLSAKLLDSSGREYGVINVLRGGNFSSLQSDLFNFCSENASILFEKVLMIKQKIFVEKRIRKAFSLFVPEQVIDSYVNGISDSESESQKTALGEKRPVAVLFCDIRSFTNISECNKPEVMIAFLNRYFTIMCNIIKKHGGTVDKFIGDAIMALFGAPVSYEDNTRRIVAAAYEMREALPSVPLGDLILPPGMKFDIGIGINYGDLTVGSLGSEDRTSYTVIGDNVNLASRLEGLTKTYGSMILVSDSVKRDIEENLKCGDFVFRYLDDVRVKGKSTPVPIYGVDRDIDEFSPVYRDCYNKGFSLYKQGVFNLAKEYFSKCLVEVPDDKASKLMKSRCEDFIANPPENWDGAIKFTTK